MDKPFDADFDFTIENIILAGDDIQKLSVIQNLPQLLQGEPQQTYSRIIPKILEELPNASCEFQVVASKVVKVFMEKQVPANLFYAVLQGIESRDAIVANSWTETLITIIPVLNEAQLKNDVLPLVNARSQLSQPLLSRIAACKMLGKIAVHASLDATDVKREIVPLVQGLCQDCHPEVRSVICTQFPYIAQGLGSGLMRGDLLACLVELGSDDNMYVRTASVSAIVQIFPYTTLDVKKATLLPLIKQLCNRSLKHDDLTAATIAKEIGKIVDGLQTALTETECTWFLNFYKRLAIKGLDGDTHEFKVTDGSMDVMCRQHAALNLPAMSFFVNATNPTQMEALHLIFRDLAMDPCVVVRRAVACSIHEVIKIFDATSKVFKSDFVHLLQDDSDEVLYSLVPHLGTTLELFCQFETLSRQTANASTLEIGRALLKCQFELESGNNWRLFKLFLHQLEHLPNCMPSDFIHQHFTPILLTCAVEGRARPVRVQAVRTLLIFLRYNSKEVHRRWLRKKLVKQLARSDSYYTRLIYIRLCATAIEIFSDRYFKEYFYDHLLDLAVDPVANIRMCVANLFTYLNQMLILPEDKLLHERFNEVLKRYTKEETDRDVVEAFQLKLKEMSQLDVNEEYKNEQKRRRDEEDRIHSGAKPTVPLILKKRSVVARATKGGLSTGNVREQSSNELVPSSRTSGLRSPNIATRQLVPSLSSQMSDMSILEQHFYIDAGVNLPTKALDASKKSKLTSKLCAASSLTGNITDDDKVNLRKLPNADNSTDKSVKKKVNKRYSSVLSETCLLKQEQKVMNRRSLNLSTKTISRIPISKAKSKSEKVQGDEPPGEAVVTAAKVSHLPVFVGRSSTDVKK
ncbi:hypothetical protein RN001_015169 [Aquatica leii]|uniref:Serine/threonine-protein phosphatase 4 regulatory subunit 4 n=1 Tax=Aquatica leii TaxID=1421715 RepID=A0AAN7PZ45_9COLE|nr:hypothetical protein RN001_015169 [Aquatica leii]